LFGLPNDPRALDLVLFQEPIDGKQTFRAEEIARFRLP
jgi:hypothetical protein